MTTKDHFAANIASAEHGRRSAFGKFEAVRNESGVNVVLWRRRFVATWAFREPLRRGSIGASTRRGSGSMLSADPERDTTLPYSERGGVPRRCLRLGTTRELLVKDHAATRYSNHKTPCLYCSVFHRTVPYCIVLYCNVLYFVLKHFAQQLMIGIVFDHSESRRVLMRKAFHHRQISASGSQNCRGRLSVDAKAKLGCPANKGLLCNLTHEHNEKAIKATHQAASQLPTHSVDDEKSSMLTSRK